jgi:hypothetical protein
MFGEWVAGSRDRFLLCWRLVSVANSTGTLAQMLVIKWLKLVQNIFLHCACELY